MNLLAQADYTMMFWGALVACAGAFYAGVKIVISKMNARLEKAERDHDSCERRSIKLYRCMLELATMIGPEAKQVISKHFDEEPDDSPFNPIKASEAQAMEDKARRRKRLQGAGA